MTENFKCKPDFVVKINNLKKGYTLIEILIVIFIFAILMFVTVQSLSLTLKGSKKSENIIKAKQNVDFTISTIERLIRNAGTISCSVDGRTLNYTDEYGQPASFSCNPSGSVNGYIASGSARLTNTEININCSGVVFNCTPASGGVPPSVKIIISGKKQGAPGSEESSVTSSTSVMLRVYD
jgi:prepilin-type N-terminal cleavage/methylation domain